jgi:hypothetical protein
MENLGKLRVAFAAALKYSDCYGQNSQRPEWWELWRVVFNGGKLPKNISLNTIAGDIFAFWYGELKLAPFDYEEIATMFFEKLREEENETQTRTVEV